MEILLTITYSALFVYLIHKMHFFEVDGISKKTFSYLFILKVLFGILLWAIYTFYYTDRATADIYKYFDDSKILFDALKTNPKHYFQMLFGIGNTSPEFNVYYNEMHYWARKIDSGIYNDSHTIIRFNAFVRLFSLGYYNVHTAFICFLSLIGLTAIYKTFVKYMQDKKRELMFVVFLLPSVLFWSSGVLKEGIIFFALGLLIFHANKLFTIRSIGITAIMTLLLALSKFYVWIAIVPSILFLIIINKTSINKLWIKYILIIGIIGSVGLNIDSFTGIQNPLVTLSQKQIEFNQLASGELKDSNEKNIPAANSRIEINKLEPTFSSFLKNSPQALINTTLRPYIWESRSPMMLMAAGENLLFILIFLLTVIYCKPLKSIQWEFVLFCLSFVLIQFLIIGETTPVLGAIARYKTIALPFLMIAFLFMVDKQKLISNIPLLKGFKLIFILNLFETFLN